MNTWILFIIVLIRKFYYRNCILRVKGIFYSPLDKAALWAALSNRARISVSEIKGYVWLEVLISSVFQNYLPVKNVQAGKRDVNKNTSYRNVSMGVEIQRWSSRESYLNLADESVLLIWIAIPRTDFKQHASLHQSGACWHAFHVAAAEGNWAAAQKYAHTMIPD